MQALQEHLYAHSKQLKKALLLKPIRLNNELEVHYTHLVADNKTLPLQPSEQTIPARTKHAYQRAVNNHLTTLKQQTNITKKNNESTLYQLLNAFHPLSKPFLEQQLHTLTKTHAAFTHTKNYTHPQTPLYHLIQQTAEQALQQVTNSIDVLAQASNKSLELINDQQLEQLIHPNSTF